MIQRLQHTISLAIISALALQSAFAEELSDLVAEGVRADLGPAQGREPADFVLERFDSPDGGEADLSRNGFIIEVRFGPGPYFLLRVGLGQEKNFTGQFRKSFPERRTPVLDRRNQQKRGIRFIEASQVIEIIFLPEHMKCF
ncbi:MAG: hypothetical protein IH987_14300 [Planctomycetes bacterium]|nr:hypothetical protein [Planctomycetota bacterium]